MVQQRDLLERLESLERAVFGSPHDNGRSAAILPTLRRWQILARAAHTVAKALLASVPAAGATVAVGRTLGWW